MLLGDSSFSFVPFATQEHDAIVIPTAQSMTFSSGTPTITGSAVVTPTAQQMTISQGDVTVEVGVDVSVSGQTATLGLGSITVVVSVVVTPTGQEMTFSSGTPAITGWTELSTNATQTWVELYKGRKPD